MINLLSKKGAGSRKLNLDFVCFDQTQKFNHCFNTRSQQFIDYYCEFLGQKMQIGSRGFSEEKHMIFCLDYSGSIKGKQWKKVENSILELLVLPEMKNIIIKNSIITLNDNSEVVEEFKNAKEITVILKHEIPKWMNKFQCSPSNFF